MRAFAPAFVALVACGTPSQTQTPTPVASATVTPNDTASSITPSACNDDSDCVVTDFTTCCSPCPDAPHAVPRIDLERQRKTCAEVECAPQKGRVQCEPTERVDAYRAVCRNRACEAVKTAQTAMVVPLSVPTPPFITSTDRCTKDDDCLVTNAQHCCMPCPVNAYATSKKTVESHRLDCATMDCAISNEKCPNVVDARLYRATCRAGTCTGVKL